MIGKNKFLLFQHSILPISKSKMILRRRGGGDEVYYVMYAYVEEADNDANKNSALI